MFCFSLLAIANGYAASVYPFNLRTLSTLAGAVCSNGSQYWYVPAWLAEMYFESALRLSVSISSRLAIITLTTFFADSSKVS
jgi:hypothetical protein